MESRNRLILQFDAEELNWHLIKSKKNQKGSYRKDAI